MRSKHAPILLLLFLCAMFATPATGTAATAGVGFAPGEVIVKFAPESQPAGRAQALATAGARDSEMIGVPRTRLVELAGGSGGVAEAVRQLESRPEVLWAEPNYTVTAAAVPNDPGFLSGSLWGLRNGGQAVPQFLAPGVTEPRVGFPGMDIGAEAAWNLSTGSPEVLIGVIDSGISRHVDLDANLRADLSRDFSQIDSEGDPLADSVGHGTHVAGTIGAVGNNGIGVTGVNWRTGLISIRALSSMAGTAADMASSVAYAGQLGLPVVNLSVNLPAFSQALADAVRLAPGTLFVAAAGNEGLDNDGRDSLPCTLPYENVICVAATGNVGDLAFFSNFGAGTVDLGAPGNGINSTVPDLEEVDYFDPDDFDDEWQTGPAGQEWMQGTGPGEDDEIWSKQPGDTQAAVDSFATAPPISLAGRKGCTVSGQYQLDLNQPDDHSPRGLLITERSVGGLQWREIGVTNQSTGKNWRGFQHSLHADGREGVRLRFRLVVPAGGVPAGLNGARLHGLAVECQAAGPSQEYGVMNGTSMAAPSVAGAAGLMLAHNPLLSTAQLREAILSTVTPLNSLAGRTVTGGMLNLAAAMQRVTPPPPPPPPPVVRPRLRTAVWPGPQALRRFRGVVFRVTSERPAAVTARAVVRWRGGNMRLMALRGGQTVRGNPRARIVEPGRISTLRLQANGVQLRRLLRVQRSGRPMRVQLAVRFFAPELGRTILNRRALRLR